MLDWPTTSRHWSPHQRYATGDVLLGLIARGWQITAIQPAPIKNRAKLHLITLQKGDDNLSLSVLDGPAIHKFTTSC
ncbi:MAG: hypothetical protein JXB30_08230 [Anaerolineae bacterium]|nr:hypothetical protein [Anaerolineae bacterium]